MPRVLRAQGAEEGVGTAWYNLVGCYVNDFVAIAPVEKSNCFFAGVTDKGLSPLDFCFVGFVRDSDAHDILTVKR